MSRIVWSNRVGGLPVVDNARSVPKKPVIWWGLIWLLLPGGERSQRNWRSQTPITRAQAQAVLAAMLDDLLDECGRDTAIDAGFRLECR